jgi:hypothetical protein
MLRDIQILDLAKVREFSIGDGYLETCAIYYKTYGAVWESIDISLHIHGSIPAGQGRVIRTTDCK